MHTDFLEVIRWWSLFLIIGSFFLPYTISLFSLFADKGYIFSKIIGIAIISYVVFSLNTLHIIPFSQTSIIIIVLISAIVNILFFRKSLIIFKEKIKIFLFEEVIFFVCLIVWSFVRGFAPDIHGLEKYMDFGFINSILRTQYFPPKDMWFTPFPVNYYYFGHLTTAVLTRLSQIPSNITFNLMVATIFAFTFAGSFSIGMNLLYLFPKDTKYKILNTRYILGGLLTAILTTIAGNLHTIYTFFLPYQNENPLPPWQLKFSPITFPNSYWYPNATRFIYNTIHEFPIYSFVVSDLHGHVLDIPFVLLTIAVLISLFFRFENSMKIRSLKLKIPLISFLLAVIYMTNAWDAIIYFLLTCFILLLLNRSNLLRATTHVLLIFLGYFIFSLPFSTFFQPSKIVGGIGVLCSPDFLTRMGRIGPFLFEPQHCQSSPWWQLLILYGFFYFWVISFLVFLFRKNFEHLNFKNWGLFRNSKLEIRNLPVSDAFILSLIILSTILIIIPEFLYLKDIYPAHYRANTMFKLVYQSFIMLSISSGYIIVRIFMNIKEKIIKIFNFYFVFFIFAILFFILVMIYPYFAINSYYGNLATYHGLDGTKYLQILYPTDYLAIQWLNKNIKDQPVILEAQGDSYTDYARVSSNTGLPTVLGWTVHEWLWRGTYDVPAPRIADIKNLYDSNNIEQTKELLKKYKVELVFVGDLERQKYPLMNEEKFKTLGKIIFQSGNTKIYKINSIV